MKYGSGLLVVALVLTVSAAAQTGEDPFEAGMTALRERDPDRAIAYFTKAIGQDPKHDAAYARRGAAHLRKQETRKALDDCNTAVRINPRSVEGYTVRGAVFLDQKDYAAALRDLDRAIELDPRAVDAYWDRAMVHSVNGDRDKVIADRRKITELDPSSSHGFLNLMTALDEVGAYDEANRAFSTAIGMKPDFVESSYAARGLVYEKKTATVGRHNAVAWVLATCPDRAVRNGREAVAMASRLAKETDHKSGEVLDTLAAAYAEDGQFAEAVRWQQRAIELLPEESRAQARERLRLYEQKRPYRTK